MKLASVFGALVAGAATAHAAVTASVSLTAANGTAVTGRVRLYLQRHNNSRPVDGNSDNQDTNQVFGIDANQWTGAVPLIIDEKVFGYPRPSLRDLEDGIYFAQAELLRYEAFERQGLPTTYMPRSCVSKGGQNGVYEKPDGTFLSQVVRFEIRRGQGNVQLVLDSTQPKASGPGCAGLGDGVDSEYIKTVRYRSEKLSTFWGRDIILEACVLLPQGFNDPKHQNAKYPLVIAHGHYSPQFFPGGGFSTSAPNCDLGKGEYNCVSAHYDYYMYKNWTSEAKDMPFTGARMLLVTLNHEVPLFDDSYSVNSEALGPYGDSIIYDFIPHIEKRFRGIGQGWARGLMGGSTGGWESAANIILYPDEFGYALAACPDPITFTHYTSIDIYNQRNAYYYNSDFKRTPVPGFRDDYSGTTYPGFVTPYGAVSGTVEEMNHRELALGTNGRSCGQWDIWGAVFGPVGPDGLTRPLYNKLTGEIDRSVAAQWRKKDLGHIVATNWKILGPKLAGKFHIAVGASDTFYLTNAVIDFKEQVERAAGGPSGIKFTFGAHDGLGMQHCFRGYEYDANGNVLPNSVTRLTYAQSLFPIMAKSFVANAPAMADTQSWRY